MKKIWKMKKTLMREKIMMNNNDYECFIALLAELVIQYRMKQKDDKAA